MSSGLCSVFLLAKPGNPKPLPSALEYRFCPLVAETCRSPAHIVPLPPPPGAVLLVLVAAARGNLSAGLGPLLRSPALSSPPSSLQCLQTRFTAYSFCPSFLLLSLGRLVLTSFIDMAEAEPRAGASGATLFPLEFCEY